MTTEPRYVQTRDLCVPIKPTKELTILWFTLYFWGRNHNRSCFFTATRRWGLPGHLKCFVNRDLIIKGLDAILQDAPTWRKKITNKRKPKRLNQTWVWSVAEGLNVVGPPSICHNVDPDRHGAGDSLVLVRWNFDYQVVLWEDLKCERKKKGKPWGEA